MPSSAMLASSLLFATVVGGAAVLTSRPGSRTCQVATWALTAFSVMVFGILVGSVIGDPLSMGTYALITAVPVLVLGVSIAQSRRLQRRIDG